jgi:hypothetical protein
MRRLLCKQIAYDGVATEDLDGFSNYIRQPPRPQHQRVNNSFLALPNATYASSSSGDLDFAPDPKDAIEDRRSSQVSNPPGVHENNAFMLKQISALVDERMLKVEDAMRVHVRDIIFVSLVYDRWFFSPQRPR